MMVDPYSGSALPNNPGSWNRYAYSGGDPVNNSDPNGLLFIGDTSISGSCDPATRAFNPAFYQQMCELDGGYDPNYDNHDGGVFSYDLGHVGPGSGNSFIGFSGFSSFLICEACIPPDQYDIMSGSQLVKCISAVAQVMSQAVLVSWQVANIERDLLGLRIPFGGGVDPGHLEDLQNAVKGRNNRVQYMKDVCKDIGPGAMQLAGEVAAALAAAELAAAEAAPYLLVPLAAP